MFASIKSWTSLEMGHVGSKSRPLSKILEKYCVRSGDLNLVQILIELGQNVCLDDTRMSMKVSHVGSTTRSLGRIIESQCRRLSDSRAIMALLFVSAIKSAFVVRFFVKLPQFVYIINSLNHIDFKTREPRWLWIAHLKF